MVEDGAAVQCLIFSACMESVPPDFPLYILKEECTRAMAHLGIHGKKRRILDYPVRRFDSHRQDILEILVKARKEFEPDVVFCPASSDIHQDHEVIHREAVRAFSGHADILGYENTVKCKGFAADVLIKLSDAHMERKLRAVGEYKSQGERLYTQSQFVQAVNMTAGVSARVRYAEAFESVRIMI